MAMNPRLVINETPLTSSFTSGRTSPYDRDSSLPPTPGEGILFTPRRAIASFDNLVELANYQERLKGAKRIVWRDRGEPVAELETLRECLNHAAKGGLRSWSLAFGIRGSVNLILALIRVRRMPRDRRLPLIRHALFGLDTWRFAAMLGTFTSLYKFLINALPMLIPALLPSESSSALEDEDLEAQLPTTMLEVPTNKRRTRLSLSARTRLILIRKQTRRWHAALAGAIAGGLAIIWEKKSRRSLIGQQLFVRGLQGSYNAYSTRKGFHIPHGDVLVFSLCCGQIMYAFLLRPDTLSHSYNTWINSASRLSTECVRLNRGLVREGKCDLRDLDTILATPDITSSNKAGLLAFRQDYLNRPPPPTYFPRYAPCAAIHTPVSSCTMAFFHRFFVVSKWILPIYGALHFVPPILLRWKSFLDDPRRMMVKAGLGSVRSSAFLGAFVVILQAEMCLKQKAHVYLTQLKTGVIPASSTNLLKHIPQNVTDILISKPIYMVMALSSGLSLFVEEKRRRGELAMYVLPKALESLWIMLRGRGWVFKTGKWGEVVLTAIAMAMVMTTYQNDPQHLSGFVRRILYQFIGPN